MPWYEKVKAGDKVLPSPLWNQTERHYRQLPSPVRVLRIITDKACQSGVLFVVKTCGGFEVELDAGWFNPLEEGNAST